MRTAHLCCGLGGSLWTGAILGWEPVYALDADAWRIDRLREQIRAGWWGELRADCATLPDGIPARLDGGVDLLAAGFSCRDISAAGRGAGLDGESTGPTYAGCLAAINAWRPRWVFLENSPRIRTRGRTRVTADLVARGYRWRDGVIAAADVGAPHRRDRWFLLAHLADADMPRRNPERSPRGEGQGREEGDAPSDGASPFADSLRDGLQIAVQQGGVPSPSAAAIEAAAGYCGAWHWNPPLPHLLRMVDGLAAGLDRGRRIEALGDAWVPLQAAAAWRLLGGPVA